MSADRPGREVAYRLFAAEYDDASLSHTESDEERAPNYVVTPTGARVNRLFVVGTLTEVTSVNDEMVRARVVDPTGAFVVYAGQYQPDQLAFLERAEPPLFVAVTGKARTFQPEDSDRVYTSVRPESIATVDADTRDRWVVGTAEQTLDRIATYARAADLDVYGDDLAEALLESGLGDGLAMGIPLAQDHYGTTPAYLDGLADLSLDAARVVAGDRDQVRSFDRQPGDAAPDAASFAALAAMGDLEVRASAPSGASEPAADATAESASEPAVASPTESAATADAGTETDVPSTSAESESAEIEHETAGEREPEETDEREPEETDELETTAADDDVETTTETTSFDESTDVAEHEDGDELGDFEAAGGGMYEMDDEEREELEEEFGAEFSTGAEVGEPGEAGIDVPEAESDPEPDLVDEDEGIEAVDATAPATELEEPADSADEMDDTADVADSAANAAASDDDGDSIDEDEQAADEGEESIDEDEEPDADLDLEEIDVQEYVVETMTDLDDGEGADREAVVSTVAEETGTSEADVEAAIQDALMGGQCYEPDDETLKAI
ncbi:RPA family protein [Natronobeatus ordinarius]|uniref:RPA family protein n=1 Tax=Natronobeatus ordinarius TaxID=2963433 RepID=UPI0020CEA9B6|nr:hypothetical protein [Natronobeatus ordinarius]